MSHTLIQPQLSLEPGRRPGADFWRGIIVSALLVAAVLLVYSRTLWHEFINFDDSLFVFGEPHVSGGFSWSGVRWAFTQGPAGDWCPLTLLSHMLDCQLYRLHPAGHHATNVLLHAASAVTLFWVWWRMANQRALPEVAQVSGGRVAAAGPSATTLQRALPEVAQVSGGRVAAAGPSATTLQRALPEVAQVSGARVAPAGPSATILPCAMVAALFALHPLRVESVAWVAERRDVLSGLLFMLALGAYDAYARRPSLSRYLAVLGWFALGLMSKLILVTLPVVFLLIDFWPLGRWGATQPAGQGSDRRATGFAWRIVWEKIPLAAMSLAAAGITLSSHIAPAANPVLTLPERLGNAAVSCVAYLGQLLVPIGLSSFYSYPEAGRPVWQVVAAATLVFAITAAAVICRRSAPWFFVGWFWYLVMLLPVLQVIAVGGHARADRYTYLSQIGIDVVLVWGAMRLAQAWPARRRVLGIAAVLVLVVLAACTWRQAGFWHDSISLWRHALACDPDNATAHYMLGTALDGADDEAAAAEYRQALELRPGERNLYFGIRSKAHFYLAYIAMRRQKFAEAIDQFEQALVLNPMFAAAHQSLGSLLAGNGDLNGGLDQFAEALKIEPKDPTIYNNRGVVLNQHGQTDAAIADFEKALQLDDDAADVHLNLARVLVDRGKLDLAISHFRRAIRLDPKPVDPYYEIARCLRTQGQTDEAARYERLGAEAARSET